MHFDPVRRAIGLINRVESVALSHDDAHIALSNIDGSVKIVDVRDGSFRTYRVHWEGVQSVAFHRREPLLAGAGWDGNIHLLRTVNDEVPSTIALGIGPLESIDFSPYAAQLVVGSQSGKVALWDIKAKQVTRTKSEHRGSVLDTRFSPTQNLIASGGSDHTVKVWDLDNDSVRTFEGHTGSVNRVAFCPYGKQLASASEDGTVKIWNLDTGDKVMELVGHTAGIYSVIYNADGSRIATASSDGSVKLWDSSSGEETLTLVKERSQTYDIAFTSDGQRLVTPSSIGRLQTWDATHLPSILPNIVRPARLSGQLVASQDKSLTCVLHSPDNLKLVWAGHDHLAHLWDINGQKEIQTFRGHEGTIWTLDFSPDGRVLVTGGEDKTVRFWDVQTGEELHQEATGGIVSNLRFARDGKALVVNNWDSNIRVWKLVNNRPTGTLSVFSLENVMLIKKLRYTLTPLGLALTPQGEKFFVGGPAGELWRCDANNAKRELTFEGHANKVHSIDASPSGDMILSASHDGTIRRWDSKTGRCERAYDGHTNIVHEVRFLPNSPDFVSVSADGSVRLWNAATGEQLAFGNHGNEVRGLSVSADGRTCVSVGFDGAVRTWDLPVGR